MGFLSKKEKIEPKLEEVKSDITPEEAQIIKQVLLSTRAVEIYSLCKDGEKIVNIASKL